MARHRVLCCCAEPGWHAAAPRRARRPAVPPPAEEPSPRRKSSRLSRLQQLKTAEAQRRPDRIDRPPAARDWHKFYREVESGAWQDRQRAAARAPLFKASPGGAPAAAPQAAAGAPTTRALRAKVSPALRTTKDWTRVQRKLLPKYLFVLDAVTAVHLLECLCRLQPPHAPDAAAAATAEAVPQQQQQQQQQQQREQRTGAAAPELSYRLLARIAASCSGPAKARGGVELAEPGGGGAASQDAAARARGFADAASERCEFDAMLVAVYAVLQHKLAAWPASTLVKVASCCGRLRVAHEGFLQAWYAAVGPQLAGQPAPRLLACLEALARLQCAPPPSGWQQQWAAAAQQLSLQRLSLPQLAALQLCAMQLRVRLPDPWWEQFRAAVLWHAGADGAPAAQQRQQQEQEGRLPAGSAEHLHPPATPPFAAAAAPAGGARKLTRPMADALSSLLCSSSGCCGSDDGSGGSGAQPHPRAWLAACLQLCLRACQQGGLSVGGALLVLAACSLGSSRCRQMREAAAARGAALQLLQQRMGRLPSPEGVELLCACLQAPLLAGDQRRGASLPPGFRAALGERLAELLPGLPTRLLLQLPAAVAVVAGASGGGQGSADDDEEGQEEEEEQELQQRAAAARLLAGFALISQARLHALSAGQVERLQRRCADAGLAMPGVWRAAVLQRLAALRGPAAAAPDGGGVDALPSPGG